MDAVAGQRRRPPATDAPDFADGKVTDGGDPLGVAGDEEDPAGAFPLLGDVVCHLGQRLGGGDARRDRDARPARHRAAKLGGVGGVAVGRDVGQVEKRLVDAVFLHLGAEQPQHLHDTPAHVAVKRVIAGEYRDAVPLDLLLDLEIRVAHLEAEGLGLVAAGDHAAVIVGQHDDRAVAQRGVEYPLARRIKVIAIHQGKHV